MIGSETVRTAAGVGSACLLAATGTAYVVFAGLSAVQGKLERFSWGESVAQQIVAANEARIRADLEERREAAKRTLERAAQVQAAAASRPARTRRAIAGLRRRGI